MSDDFSILLRLTNPCFSRRGYDFLWEDLNFEIVMIDYGLQEPAEQDVGKLRARKLHVEDAHWRKGFSLLEAFDNDTMDIAQYYDVIFKKNGDLRERFSDERYDIGGGMLPGDFHILETISIDERFKGHDIAREATAVYLESFARGDDAVFFKAFPLQYDAKTEAGDLHRSFVGSFNACQSRLCKYYERIGFSRVGTTPYFFFAAGTFLDRMNEDE